MILRCFFFYFTAQKSFYQAKHKEVSTELQTKTSQLEESKKRIIALENESLAKQAEVKKVKRELEEKDNDIHGLSYDKDGLRQELKELNTQMETLKGIYNILVYFHFRMLYYISTIFFFKKYISSLFTAKKGTLESLVQSKEMKITELRSQLDEQKVEMDHKTSHETSLGKKHALK